MGDSDGGRSRLNAWLDRLEALKRGEESFTLIIEDPLANSFVYSPYGTAEEDPYMTAEKFKRSEYEDECLGIADMKTENYNPDVEDGVHATTAESDKDTMSGGGRAIDPSNYHPNPNAVMHLDGVPPPAPTPQTTEL